MVARAIDPLKTVIMSGLYDLIDDPSQLGRPAADFCKEYIFEHNASESDGYPAYQADNRHIWRTPRPEHMNLPDQLYPMGWGFCVPTGDFGRFLERHEGGVEKPRFKASILTYDQIMDMSYTLTSGPGVFAAGIPHCEGYFNAKTLLYREDIISMPGWWKYSKSNVAYMRYAEVLLLYAEAQFVANGDADGSGADALNKVRRRAQIPEVGALTYQIIKDERRAELFAEQERYFDLVRWGDLRTRVRNGTHSMAISLVPKSGAWSLFRVTEKAGMTNTTFFLSLTNRWLPTKTLSRIQIGSIFNKHKNFI